MINARRIVSPEDGLYAECVRIYEESFPYEERRDTAEMTEYLSDARFHFIVFYEQREEDGPAETCLAGNSVSRRAVVIRVFYPM